MKKEIQICMNCLNDFEEDEVFWVLKGGKKVLHCAKCLKEKKIVEFEPFSVKKKRKTKIKLNN